MHRQFPESLRRDGAGALDSVGTCGDQSAAPGLHIFAMEQA